MSSTNRHNLMYELLLEKLAERLSQIEARHKYLSYLINTRFRNEKFLQIEVMIIVDTMNEVIDYLPEKPYPNNPSEKCDVWFKTVDDTEYWGEVKMIPTNYRFSSYYHSKGIKRSIDSLIYDIKRLKTNAPKNAKKFVLFTVYPMYEDSYRYFSKQLKRISSACGKEVKAPNKRVKVGGAYFDVYLVEI